MGRHDIEPGILLSLQRDSRHTTAMHLRQSGMPFNVIALRLGHESTNTTHRYVEANPEIKEKALARLDVPDVALKRFRASGELMKFLQALQLYKAPRPSARSPAHWRADSSICGYS